MMSATSLLLIILAYVGLRDAIAVPDHRAESANDQTKRFVFGASPAAEVTA